MVASLNFYNKIIICGFSIPFQDISEENWKPALFTQDNIAVLQFFLQYLQELNCLEGTLDPRRPKTEHIL